jgi:hypothetical protein
LPAEDEPEAFEVYPENWQAACLFLTCATQWRIESTPKGNFPTGLEYGSVETVLRIHDITDRPDIFTRLQLMEAAALEEFRRKFKQ